MQYPGTAVHIYDMPERSGARTHWRPRLAQLVAAIGLLALLGLLGFVVFGIVSQRL